MGLKMNPDMCSVIVPLVWVKLKWKRQCYPIHVFLADYELKVALWSSNFSFNLC